MWLRSALAFGLLLTLPGCIISPKIPSWPEGPQGTLTLNAAEGFIIPAQINGHPVRLRVDTGYSGVVLNPSVAARIGIPRSMFDASMRVGPVRVEGQTGVAPVTIGHASDERRILWFEKDMAADADGVINIASLPHESVTLQLRPAQAGETAFELHTTPMGFWSLAHDLRVGERDIEVRFALDVPRTLLTAAAGAQLAAHHGGEWSGEPFEHRVALDVRRPVRPMAFSRPVAIANLRLSEALVRTSDNRGRETLPTDDADPGEIVISGSGRTSRAYYTAIIGRDHLAACSSLTYTGRTRVLTLRCRAG
jgi:hypothetical protein